jgi:PAS domain S-box-containing protein
MTAKKKKDKAVDTSKLLHVKALEYVNDGVMILDSQGHVVYADPSMVRMLGTPAEELRDAPERISEHLNFQGGLSLKKVLEAVKKEGQWSGEATCATADKHAVLLDVSCQRLDDTEDKSMGVIMVARDVTRERTLEQQVVQSQQMELVENLSIGIAHEFRNLLTVMLAYATLLQEETKGMPCQQDVTNLMETVERANELTKRMLSITRRTAPSIEPVDVQKILDDVVAVLHKSLPEEVTFYSPENLSLPQISADAAILYRAILNLCLNARDAMPNGGTITIEADRVHVEKEDLENMPDRTPGDYVTLAVTDTGDGMPMDVKKRIFEPFFSTKKHGTGLGLSVVQHSLAAMGGWITVYSEEGLGSCFRLYIPVAKFKEEKPKKKADETAIMGGSETIMVVDDDPLALNAARRSLERSGYTVLSATGGENAVAIFKQNCDDIDLVLLDVVMPYMNGEEVYQELARIQPGVKVIAVSGFSPKSAERLLRAEGVSFLAKPYTRAALCKEIRSCLGRPS